jgi:major membrane immunogen (membrane-anchored lipoprotein)
MRSKFVAGAALAAFMLVACAASAAAKPNFSGTWALDAAKSDGLRGPSSVTMTVKQDGDKLDVTRQIKDQQGDRTTNDTYTADGKEGEFTMQMMGNSQKGKRTAKWSADGTTLEIRETATIERQGQTVDIETVSKWSLSADGKTLTVDQTRTSPMGAQSSKRVFNKQ